MLLIKIPVDGIIDGKMIISCTKKNNRINNITDKTGKIAILFNEIHCFVPTGVELNTAEAITGNNKTAAKVTKEVTSSWKVRGIAWILLTENSKPVKIQNSSSTALLQDAIPVHGHEFASFDNEATAKAIASALTQYYGDRYNISSKGSKFTVEAKSASPNTSCTLDIQVLDKLKF